MKVSLLIIVLALLAPMPGWSSSNSTIAQVEGSACLGDDKTRKQTERAALVDAKRNALEFTGSHINSTTQVKNYELQSDIIKAYASGEVKILEILHQEWLQPERECYQVSLRAEVVPDSSKIKEPEQQQSLLSEQGAPLQVKLWTDQQNYRQGEQMHIFMQANKDFYGRLVYTDAQQNQLQVLPNQIRRDSLFRGGQVYRVPSAEDDFVLSVGPPFGSEILTLFASTVPLGNLESTDSGSVYRLSHDSAEIADKSRGLSIAPTRPASGAGTRSPRLPAVAEFSEQQIVVTTSGY